VKEKKKKKEIERPTTKTIKRKTKNSNKHGEEDIYENNIHHVGLAKEDKMKLCFLTTLSIFCENSLLLSARCSFSLFSDFIMLEQN